MHADPHVRATVQYHACSPLSVLPSPPASPRDWQDLICPAPAEQPGQPGLQPAGLPATHSEPPHHLPALPASVPERAVSGEGVAGCLSVSLSVCLSVCLSVSPSASCHREGRIGRRVGTEKKLESVVLLLFHYVSRPTPCY